ncbi:putative N-acetyltransferase, MSMEG_0567 N-terminal domain family [Pseudonocardia ammonioxydans]|uniref:Putative N-acetyltransferase, MSMEG_0567 N-terminal domain family n=1 Tax=Pseudonocardia ammonioxydans TaxID=260086 RepID=A0A1I4XMR4_PSUAM|nr:MSMEG_0567/Sll0786 family nitrogen starvation N-acetyltransferase [Pseudonocardia ammonioxydans]SFN26610.1 putative N-acetyltransferase, MSMEG_0567 N-terminal domain family [Pseudonocardia ammonioxydans]
MTRAEPSPARTATGVHCTVVTGADIAEHHRIRHAVFVTEQGVFADSDVDAHDARPDVVHVLATLGGQAVGTVRLYPVDDAGLWRGDRLAVLPGRRTAGAGAPLVRFAVATAAARGGTRMVAHVQPPNRRFFEHLGWTAGGVETYAGFPHVAMTIGLRHPGGEVSAGGDISAAPGGAGAAGPAG